MTDPVRVHTANIKTTLHGKRLDRAITKAAAGADILLVQEAGKARHVRRLRALPGFEGYYPNRDRTKGQRAREECPILWRTDRFTANAQGSQIIGRGIAHIQPNRTLARVHLHDRQTGQVIGVMCTHTVSGVWRNLARKFAAWAGRTRRQESDHELAAIAARTRTLAAHTDWVVGGGDLNRRKKLAPGRLGADRIVYAARPTHGRSWYDLLWLTGATATSVHRIPTPSDHDVLAAALIPTKKGKPVATSQNGWPVHISSAGLVSLRWITGRVAADPVHGLFEILCARFDSEVEKIRRGWSWGWSYRPIRGQASGFSNHASGTAVDLNAPKHPLGKVGTFTPRQRAAIHRLLADFDGAIRWGGDYHGRKDEMHFEINTSRAHARHVLHQLTQPAKQEDDMPYTPAQLQKVILDSLATKRGQRLIRRAVLKDAVGNDRPRSQRANPANDRIWLNTAIQRILERTHD